MNIWIFNQHALPGDAAGGTRHAVLAKYLQRLGHSLTIFAADIRHTGGKAFAGSGRTRPDVPSTKVIDHVNWRFVPVRSYHSPLTRVLSMRSYRSSAIAATSGLATPDVIIGSCVHPYAVDAAIRVSRRHQVPFVYEIRDIWPASLRDIGVLSCWNPIYWKFRQLEVRGFSHAQGVIGVCPGMQQYAADHGVSPECFLYAPNGIDPEVFPEIVPLQDSRLFTVTYLGSQGPVNGLMTLVEAAQKLQQQSLSIPLRIRLIGDGAEGPRLKQEVAKRGLRNIEFVPPVVKSEVVRWCQMSDAFVYVHRPMPIVARYGVSANKIFDYLAAARPVVFSCDSFNNPVRDANAGYSVPAGDALALAAAIARISQVPVPVRQRFGANGRAYVLKHHNLERIAGQWDVFLRWIVAQSGGTSRRVA